MVILDFLVTYSWIVWIALILIFGIIELTTLEFTFLMLAIGSVVGLLAGLLGAPWWLQIVLAAAASVLLLLAVRPPLLRALQRGADPARSNVDALLGISGVVVSTVTPHGGQVKLGNGETWTARTPLDSPASSLEPGTRVILSIVDGATAVVIPVPSQREPLDEQKEQS